tara:strand:+ start:50 stop:961 length:912 start_codon:yes stop_codon:yes gene_type:complete
MADFAIRSGSIDVEEIMRHIRKRIRDKRGVDYTEQEIRELANVKLQRILDPTGVRSDLLKHFRERPKTAWPENTENYSFENHTIYASTRGLVVFVRRLLRPVLKLLFSPNPLIDTLHKQSTINAKQNAINSHIEARFGGKDNHDALSYEILNNLVVEITRLSIEVNNLKMQVQSVNSRLDFDERRARALEGLVNPPAAGTPTERKAKPDAEESGDGTSKPRRRRRRRRGGRRRTTQDEEVNQTAEAETKIAETENQEEPSPIAETAVGAGSDKSAESSTEEPERPEAATPRTTDDGAADTPEK